MNHDTPNDVPTPRASTSRTVRIGTRRSALALKQAHLVRDALAAVGLATELVTFSTVGDERLDVPLPQLGGKGVFTAELEAALLTHRVDLCVHSLKDLPTVSPAGLDIGAVLPREDARDVVLMRGDVQETARTLQGLPAGARIGTSSLRRGAQLRQLRPDVQLVDLRGNVPTRIRKLDEGQMEAIVLAAAGLRRLGLEGRITQWLDTPAWLPAPAQGVIAIQLRSDDAELRTLLAPVHDAAAWDAAVAERAFLHALEGGCHVPVGALAATRDGERWLDGVILDVEGGDAVRGSLRIDGEGAAAAEVAGVALASTLVSRGGAQLLARVRALAASDAPRS